MFTFEFIPNLDCNLDCYFCFASKKDEVKRIEPDDFLKSLKVIEKVINDDKLFIKIYGGESLLYIENIKKYLLKIKEFKKQSDLEVTCAIVTNGTIMPDTFLDFIKKIDLDISFSFSFEINEEYQNKIRFFKNNPEIGSYNIFKNNIDKFRKKMCIDRAHLQSVLTPELLLNVNKYIDFMEENKDKYIFDLNPMFDETFSNYDKKILNNMSILFDYYIKKIKEQDDLHIGLFQPMRSTTSFFINSIQTCEYHCSAGVNQITLISNGDIYPCSKNYHLGNYDMKYGNISESIDDLAEKINSQKNLYKVLITHDSKCNQCKAIYKFGCLGDCMAERVNNNNEHYEWVCEYNRKFGLETLRMIRELKDNEYFFKKISYNQNTGIKGFNEKLFNLIKEFR